MNVIGNRVEQLDTPVLWVDLDIMEKNIHMISTYLREAGVAWRPHTKGIKIPAIAHKLIQAGAVGITCAKLGEAEVMAAAGIRDILVANQIVGETKIVRLCALQHHAQVIAAVCELENAQEISRLAQNAGVKVPVLVELNIGMNRAGIAPEAPALDLAQRVAELPGLKLAGLLGWEGHVVSMPDPHEKRQAGEKAVGALVHTAKLCREAGLEIPIVSCGGTGSFRISAHIPGVTEVEAGGIIFGDVTYRRWGAGMNFALFVMVTVIGRPTPTQAIIDAGHKTMNAVYAMPELYGIQGAALDHQSAEHGVLKLENPSVAINTGDKLNFVPGYGDLTVFMHDRLYGVRGGKVEVVWDILGRGKLA